MIFCVCACHMILITLITLTCHNRSFKNTLNERVFKARDKKHGRKSHGFEFPSLTPCETFAQVISLSSLGIFGFVFVYISGYKNTDFAGLLCGLDEREGS